MRTKLMAAPFPICPWWRARCSSLTFSSCDGEGGKGWRCGCVRVGTETDVNVEGVDLPHLTNHSDTLVGVQIDNWRG